MASPSYYEILEVEPTADSASIEAAWDRKYNQWRQLVTHRQYAEQAKQALTALEEVRATLLDPGRRAAYDRGIGLGEPLAGLALKPEDLAAVPRVPSPPAPLPATSRAPSADRPPCPHCGAVNNPDDARLCITCRGSLTQTCPGCKAELPWHYANCTKCGCNIAEERERQEQLAIESEAALRKDIQRHLAAAGQLLAEKRWRAAQDELAHFEGLGARDQQKAPRPICSRDRPEWAQAQALDQSVAAVRNSLTKSLVGWTALVYAGLGLIVGAGSGSGDGFFACLLLFPAVAALAAWIYAAKWGGKSGSSEDHVLAALAPIGLVTVGVGVAVVLAIVALLSGGGGG